MLQMMQMMSMMQQSTMQMEQPAARSSGLKIFDRLADKSQGSSSRLPLPDSPAAESSQNDSPQLPALPAIEDRKAAEAPQAAAGSKTEGSDAVQAPGELSVPPGSSFSMHALQICKCALIHHACISQVYVTRKPHP